VVLALELGGVPPFYGDAFCGGFWPNVDASIALFWPFLVRVSFLFWPQALLHSSKLMPIRHDGSGPYELAFSSDESFYDSLYDGLYGEPWLPSCVEQS